MKFLNSRHSYPGHNPGYAFSSLARNHGGFFKNCEASKTQSKEKVMSGFKKIHDRCIDSGYWWFEQVWKCEKALIRCKGKFVCDKKVVNNAKRRRLGSIAAGIRSQHLHQRGQCYLKKQHQTSIKSTHRQHMEMKCLCALTQPWEAYSSSLARTNVIAATCVRSLGTWKKEAPNRLGMLLATRWNAAMVIG